MPPPSATSPPPALARVSKRIGRVPVGARHPVNRLSIL
jgi:hypothetical protein